MIAATLAIIGPARAEPAHVWLSTCNIQPFDVGQPTGPEAPSFTAVQGTERRMFLWAQPQTVGAGAHDSNSNPFKTLKNISLNLTTEGSSSLDILDDSVIFRPLLAGPTQRFQEVNDSSVGLVSLGGPERLAGLAGFSIFPDSGGITFTGIGPACAPGDPFCDGVDADTDAWLLGAVSVKTTASSGTTNLFLQIGENGINHANGAPPPANEPSSATEVLFGTDAAPSYNGAAHREIKLGGDTPDAVITTVAAATPVSRTAGDGNWNDPSKWSTASVPSTVSDVSLNNSPIDVTTVHGCARANHTNVIAGRLHIADNGSLSSAVDVNANAKVSGGGWVTADVVYQNNAVHAIDGIETLDVIGSVTLGGGVALELTEDYSQPAGTVATFDLLSADDITGTIIGAAGDFLGHGIFLASAINNSSQRIEVALRNLPGDYDGNGTVEPADYAVWKGAFGSLGDLPADGNGDHVVNAADYAVWRDNLGSVAVPLGSGAGTAAVVPEAATAWLAIVLALSLPLRRTVCRWHDQRCGC